MFWEQRIYNGNLYTTRERAVSTFLLGLEHDRLEIADYGSLRVGVQINLFNDFDDFTVGAFVRRRKK